MISCRSTAARRVDLLIGTMFRLKRGWIAFFGVSSTKIKMAMAGRSAFHPKQSGPGDKIGAIDADLEKEVSFRRARSRQDRLRYHLAK